jgi:hypothetical protein
MVLRGFIGNESEPVLKKEMGFFVFKYIFEKMRRKNSKVKRDLL